MRHVRAAPGVLVGVLAVGAPLAGAACSSHAAGGAGDPPSSHEPSDPRGSGARLSELNAAPFAPTAPVSVTGVVVTAKDDFDETGDGKSMGVFFVQDAVDGAPAYSGVEVFGASFTPPDLRIAPGDVVDVRGDYERFPGPPSFLFPPGETLPELSNGTVGFRYEYAVPAPRVIDLHDLVAYVDGRQWLSMLVTIEDVRVGDDGAVDSSGRYTARLDAGAGIAGSKIPAITNALFAVDSLPVALTAGTHLKSITGIVEYFVRFQIAPRSAADIVF